MQNTLHTAILVFTRTAAEEAIHKAYTGNADVKANRQIAQSFIAKTLVEADNSGLPVFTVSSDQQTGNCFGERLTNAIADIFEKGYHNVITIGTDTPDLSAIHIRKVARLLQTHDYVSGPSADGGVYIIGFNKKVFNKRLLKDIPWQSATVNNSLHNYIQQHGYSQTEIEELTDVDDLSSLNYWLNHTTNIELVYYIKQLLHKSHYLMTGYTSNFICIIYSSSLCRRGPPIAA